MSKPYRSKIKKFKYEAMLVVDGELSVEEARESISNLLALFSDKENYAEYVMANSPLAYVIKGKKVSHRFVLNFELEDPSVLSEFNRLALLSKTLLRHLIINETKDKGFRARNNPKKVKDYEIRQEKKRQYIELKKSLISLSTPNAS